MRFHLSSFLAAAALATVAALATAVAVAPVGAAATEHTVSMKRNKFSPSTLHIQAGDTIEFVNRDKVSHVVYSLTPGHYFASGRQAPGARATFVFDRSGAFDAFSSGAYGRKMKLHVVVAESRRETGLPE